MNISLNETQIMVRDILRRYLAGIDPATIDPAALWQALAGELAILAAPLDECFGGLGGGAIDAMVVAGELGRACAPAPFASAVAAAAPLLAATGREGLIEAITNGTLRIALAGADCDPADGTETSARATLTADGDDWRLDGRKILVSDSGNSTHLLLRAEMATGDPALLLLPCAASGIVRHDYPLVDGRLAADFTFENCPVRADMLIAHGNAVDALLLAAHDRAIAAQCAEAVGIMSAMFDQTVAYVKQRVQFGRPIAEFQVVQHRLADMLIEVEQAESMAWVAACNIGSPRHVSAAKVRVDQALRTVAHGAVQLHGGIGTTDELVLSRYFKRALVIQRALGSADQHMARYEALSSAA